MVVKLPAEQKLKPEKLEPITPKSNYGKIDLSSAKMGLIIFLFYGLFISYPLGKLWVFSFFGQSITISTFFLGLMGISFVLTLFFSDKFNIYLPRAVIVPLTLLFFLFLMDLLNLPRSSNGPAELIEDFSAMLLVVLTSFIAVSKPKAIVRGFQLMGIVLALGGIFAFIQSLGIPLWSELEKPTKLLPLGKLFFRTTGFPMDYGLYGVMNLSILPLALISAVRGGGLYRSRWVGRIVSILILIAIIISQDRSMWLAVSLVCFILIISYTLIWFKKSQVVFVAFLISTVFLMGLVTFLSYKAMPLIYSSNKGSIQQRLEQYTTALDLIRAQPLTGIGNGRFSEFYTPKPTPTNPNPSPLLHNYFLNEAVSTGIISAAALVILFGWAAFRFLRFLVRAGHLNQKMFVMGLVSAWLGMTVELLFYPGGSGLKIIWIYLGLASTLNGFGLENAHEESR